MCEIPSSDTLTQLDANAILRECRGEVINKILWLCPLYKERTYFCSTVVCIKKLTGYIIEKKEYGVSIHVVYGICFK